MSRLKNKYVIDDDVAYMHTSGGIVLIDPEDVERVSRFYWAVMVRGDVSSAIWDKDTKKASHLKLHRFIMSAPVGMVVDHINHDPLDNRKSNLRICTTSQNGKNLRIKKNNTSGYPGVRWQEDRKKWRAEIKLDYKNLFLGRYDTKAEAIQARRNAEVELYGDYAPLNEVINETT